MLETKNKLGYIRFSKGVIIRIINDAALSCGGRVDIQNFKGKYKSVIPGKDDIIIKDTDDGLYITVFIVLKFGASIRENAEHMVEYIRHNTKRVMGDEPEKITVVVTGVQSKETARRHIVYSSGKDGMKRVVRGQ